MPRPPLAAVLVLAVISTAPACADDTPATTIDFGDGGSATVGHDTVASVTAADDTATTGPATGSATGGSADGTETSSTTTGGPAAVPGQTMSQMVSAGDRSTSQTYQLVFTVGQPSQLQATHESATYRLRGGLVGANGSPP